MRIGAFTSSEIWKLTTEGKGGGFGKPALTYIQEKRFELLLGRSLSNHSFSYPTSWGNLVEGYVHGLLGLEYKLASKDVIQHPEIERWKGTPDLITDDKVSDIKCPFTLKSFCELVDACQQGIETFKKEIPEYYWQLVSNSILTGKDIIELIVFVPYQSELQAIREYSENYDGDDPFQFKWVYDSHDRKLPYLIEENHYKNLNLFQFEVPKADQELLTSKVLKALAL